MATYDGSNLFGVAVNVDYNPVLAVTQTDDMFGLDGVQQLHGGTRDMIFQVTGLLVGSSPAEVIAAESLLNSYVDGVGRQFVDNAGRTYDNVVVASRVLPKFQPKPCNFGYGMHYSIMMRWLGV